MNQSPAQKIQAKIAKLVAELYSIQHVCPHPQEHLNKVNKANTGNYDPSENCYWAEYKCDLCEKWWIGEQNERKGKDER